MICAAPAVAYRTQCIAEAAVVAILKNLGDAEIYCLETGKREIATPVVAVAFGITSVSIVEDALAYIVDIDSAYFSVLKLECDSAGIEDIVVGVGVRLHALDDAATGARQLLPTVISVRL